MVWLKFLHVTAISFWAGGLICVMFLHPRLNAKVSFLRLREIMHYSLQVVIAPAAYLAIGSGAALIFLRETFVPWFSLKLVFVGILVIAHMLVTRAILNLFKHDVSNSGWYLGGLFTAISLATFAVLALVLAKPSLHASEFAALFEPGGLRVLAARYTPF